MRSRAIGQAIAVAAAISLAACSSSGGASSVSTSKLESKLKSEPTIKQVLSQGGTKSKVANQLVDCIAKALEQNANKSDLSDYVNGKKNLDDIGGSGKGSANNAESDARTCVENAAKSDKSSAP